MKKLFLLLLLLSAPAFAQNRVVQGFCSTGGIQVSTQGMNSTTTVLASYPRCLVTVYDTGTTNLSTIYDASGAQMDNPFTAKANASWLFYATNGAAFDIVLSGGSPLAFPVPFTLTDVVAGGGGGGGANFPNIPSVVFSTSPSSSRPGTSNDIVNLWFGCTGFLKSDGTCSTSTAGAAGQTGQIQFNTNGALTGSGATADKKGNLTMNLSLGYRAAATALQTSRDSAIQSAIVRPDDFCLNASSGIAEASPCWNKAIAHLASTNSPTAIRTLSVPYTQNGYYFGVTNFLINLPRDFGDYHGAAGFLTAANVGLNFLAGQLVSCTVSGGSLYAPNAQLPVQITDPTYTGSGANANVATDASGTPTGCTVTTPGMNYPSVGPNAVLIPLGGDGAAGTVDLVNGSFTNPQLTAQGSGYATGLTAGIPGLAGCTGTLPALTTTVAGAKVTGFSITQAGTACTFGGSLNATGVLVTFGASCGGQQCHIMAPEPPLQQACSVALRNGVNIQGIGNPIIHTPFEFDGGVMSLTEPVPFCDPFGDQLTAAPSNPQSQGSVLNANTIEVSGLTIRGYVGFWLAGVVESAKFTDITFDGAIPIYAGSFMRVTNFIQGASNTMTQIQDSSFRSYSGPVCASGWTSRNIRGGAGGVFGGTIMGHWDNNVTPYAWGQCRDVSFTNVALTSSAILNTTAATALDTLWERTMWKTQNGPATPITTGLFTPLSNGSTTCPITQLVVDRTTDFIYGAPYQAPQAGFYPYYMCYPGISGTGISSIPRYWDGNLGDQLGTSIEARHINGIGTYRPIIGGDWSNVTISDIYTDNGAGSVPTDPYRPAGFTSHAISLFGPITMQGDISNVIISRGFYSDGLQARQLTFPSPFVNGFAVHNVFNVVNQNYPIPVIADPANNAPCVAGQLWTNTAGTFLYGCVAANARKRSPWVAY